VHSFKAVLQSLNGITRTFQVLELLGNINSTVDNSRLIVNNGRVVKVE